MTPEYDLYQEIEQKIKQLEVSIKQLRKTGSAYAQAERDYKVLLASESLKLRDEGMPVTLIDKVCYGIESVAQKRFDRDIAEVTYRANLEAINGLKLQIKILDNQISREWGAPSNG